MSRLRSLRRGELATLFVGGALGAAVLALAPAGGCAGEEPAAPAPGDGTDVPETCGDGVCTHDDGEVCENCAADCGACPACGNGICEDDTGLESCESCAEDCGACSACGDGSCVPDSGEDCASCADDCGVCEGCGDGTCSDTETCDSCEDDCGACDPCGDGTCGEGESCSSCPDDCGACGGCGDGTCDESESCESCAKDCQSCARKGCVQGNFKAYWGGLHAHTHVSDGKGSPGEAFAHASKVTKPPLDFLWLSDHHNGITQTEWKGCVAAANKHNAPGKFAAGCGFEKTAFGEGGKEIGHFNTLFPDKLYKMPHNLGGIYQRLSECGPCVGQFNHPPWPGTFLDYKFFPVAKNHVRLVEFNGRGTFDAKMGAYFEALGNGWRMSPSWNEDNHRGGWGDTKRATMIWAPELTRASVRAAVLANRTAATDDDTSSLKMMADDVCWMGSKLRGLGETKITVTLSDKQQGDGFGVVRLLGPGQKELGTRNCSGKNPCTVNFKLDLKQKTHVVAVARQQDGDVIVSGPIWYEP